MVGFGSASGFDSPEDSRIEVNGPGDSDGLTLTPRERLDRVRQRHAADVRLELERAVVRLGGEEADADLTGPALGLRQALDGVPPEPAIERHIEQCPACAEYAAEMRALDAALLVVKSHSTTRDALGSATSC